MAWIFQAIPKRYDLRTRMKRGDTETWLVTRYRDEMKRGDHVYMWSAGPEGVRGLYGIGTITSDEVEFYPEWGHGVDVRYDEVFDSHIPFSEVRDVPEMADHVLLKMPIGTNFKLTEEQEHALDAFVKAKRGGGHD